MSKFKVGDKIRCNEDSFDLTKGTVYTVIGHDGSGDARVIDDSGDVWSIEDSDFELSEGRYFVFGGQPRVFSSKEDALSLANHSAAASEGSPFTVVSAEHAESFMIRLDVQRVELS